MHSNQILLSIEKSFESASYSDRISGMNAFKEIIPLTNDDEAVNKIISKVIQLISGKYFTGKEEILSTFATMLQEGLIDAPFEYARLVI